MTTNKIAEPLYFKPLMMERVWGGNRLSALHGKPIPPGKTIGESWELVDRPEAQSQIVGGPLDGKTLREALLQYPQDILGSLAHAKPKFFPLLLKYVDAGSPLSVQVHPDDIGAKAFNDRGKSECWVIVHADAGAEIVRGLKPGTTRQQYEDAVAKDRVEDVLHAFKPRVGDLVALPPGMVHAIGTGLVVAEIQQNSDLTFRIYDYKRLGLDGRPRQLHVKEALSAIRFEGNGDEFAGDMRADTVAPLETESSRGVKNELLLHGRYFDLRRYTITPGAKFMLPARPEAPRVLMCISGAGTLGGGEIKTGQTVLLPAAQPEIEVLSHDGNLTLLVSAPTVASC